MPGTGSYPGLSVRVGSTNRTGGIAGKITKKEAHVPNTGVGGYRGGGTVKKKMVGFKKGGTVKSSAGGKRPTMAPKPNIKAHGTKEGDTSMKGMRGNTTRPKGYQAGGVVNLPEKRSGTVPTAPQVKATRERPGPIKQPGPRKGSLEAQLVAGARGQAGRTRLRPTRSKADRQTTPSKPTTTPSTFGPQKKTRTPSRKIPLYLRRLMR